jgi:hypothetical protein
VQRVQVAPAVQEAKPADKPKAGGGGR